MTSRRNEAGLAMPVAILAMVLAIGLMAAIALAVSGDRGLADRRAHSIAALAPADDASDMIQRAFEAGLADEQTNFNLSSAAMTAIKPNGAVVHPNSWVGAQPVMARYRLQTVQIPAAYRFTMELNYNDPLKPYARGFWQVYASHSPDLSATATSNMVVYVRAWTTDGSASNPYASATRPRLMRVELRPYRFSDYQVVADGPIRMGNGAEIDGRMHSNGFDDSFLLDTDPGYSLQVDAGATCGPGAMFSTAKQGIKVPAGCSSAPRRPNTGKFISFLRVEDALVTMRARCGTGIVRCYTGAAPGGTYNVVLGAGTVRVNGGGDLLGSSGRLALLLGDDINLRGHLTGGQVTIATKNNAANSGAAGVTLTGDTYTSTAASSNDILGIIAQGNISPSLSACPDTVNAAMVSESGALTVPQAYRVPAAPGMNTPLCPILKIRGSVSGHNAPMLHIVWKCKTVCYSPPEEAGYAEREYHFNRNLLRLSPPFFPTTGPWNVLEVREANTDCLTTAALDPSCL